MSPAVTSAMTATAGMGDTATERSAMTVGTHIATAVVAVAEEIDIGAGIAVIVTTVVTVARVITVATVAAIDVANAAGEEHGKNQHQRVTRFHLERLTGLACAEMG